jgi:hypothetical protein
MHRRFLYRRLSPFVTGLLLLFAMGVPRADAQMPQLKRPQDEIPEKPPEPKKPKKVKGPRAVALLETSSDGKTALIPVAILVEGKFYDASEYKADPVPMALYSGTVYEVEQTGISQGLFTVSRALHSKSPANPHPWLGTGSYLANGSQAATNFRKAEDKPVGIDSSGSDEPPRLTREGASPKASTPAPSNAGPGSSDKTAANAPSASSDKSAGTPPPSPSSPEKSPSRTNPDKPATASGAPSPDTKQPASQAPSTEKSSATQPSQTQPSASSQQDQSQSSANYYRPALRRGKPTAQIPPGEQDDEEGLKAVKLDSKTTPPAAKAISYRYAPAISDEGGPDPRSYKFFWKPGEEDERRTQMLALAAKEVNAYVAAEARNLIAPKPAPAQPASAKAASRKPAAKPPQPVFENIQFQGFDVWLNNQPVMVLTADAHMPLTPGAATPPISYSITLVARTDIYGDLRKLYLGVTDKFHLDVTPRLELIDVVDADGDGRGDLLFKETTDAGSGYIIYRATADKLWKLFDSLGET